MAGGCVCGGGLWLWRQGSTSSKWGTTFSIPVVSAEQHNSWGYMSASHWQRLLRRLNCYRAFSKPCCLSWTDVIFLLDNLLMHTSVCVPAFHISLNTQQWREQVKPCGEGCPLVCEKNINTALFPAFFPQLCSEGHYIWMVSSWFTERGGVCSLYMKMKWSAPTREKLFHIILKCAAQRPSVISQQTNVELLTSEQKSSCQICQASLDRTILKLSSSN